MISYLVCEFSKPTVSNLVKECFGSDFPDVFGKQQLNYIYQYLNDMGAKSVLLEREYLDKDYLEDFSRYYVKCFKNAGHKCARLHFFTTKVDHAFLDEVLAKGNSSAKLSILRGAYLGFTVVKPLPMTFVGKTCLKQYPTINTASDVKRCISRLYKVDLFGIELEVESVAFQEQDRVVSACATTAIWSSLHATRWNSEKQIPACSEITTNAINHIDGSHNSFPNKGLTNKQILRALDVEGLRYYNEVLRDVPRVDFFETVRYHIDSGIPLILGVEIVSKGGNELQPKHEATFDGHAVTIIGYSKEEGCIAFYIHDDRLGPFAKATFSESEERTELVVRTRDGRGDWIDSGELLVPKSLTAPTNKKVRIPYVLPLNTCKLIVQEYDEWMRHREEKTGLPFVKSFANRLSFSLKLSQISEIRQEIINHQYSPEDEELIEEKRRFLTGNYARFQWVATFYVAGRPAFKLLFDATDIPQGDAVSGIFIEDGKEAEGVLVVLRAYANAFKKPLKSQNENFYSSVLKFLKKRKPKLVEHLDKTYGDVRAPLYLKEAEFAGGDISGNESVKSFFENTGASLDDEFKSARSLIWAIAEDGALLVGRETEGRGHPTLTGFKPARIAGELNKADDGVWIANSKSGRYSGDYRMPNNFLENALQRIRAVFPGSRFKLEVGNA